MNTQKTAHEFAIFIKNLTDLAKGFNDNAQLVLTDSPLIFRITRILRLNAGDSCIVFDNYHHTQAHIKKLEKKTLLIQLGILQKNISDKPTISVLLPILKKDALETALYNLVELGTTNIQLIVTDKTHHADIKNHEFERLEKIMIAAAEQSKNFAGTVLKKPISLSNALEQYGMNKIILLDPSGNSFIEHLEQLPQKNKDHYIILVGPEGDLTVQEKQLLHNFSASSCSLTKTVLRSQQAISLAVGILRTLA